MLNYLFNLVCKKKLSVYYIIYCVFQKETEEPSVPVTKPLTLDIKRVSVDEKPKPTPPTSPLLSTLLQSSKSSFGDLQQLKQVHVFNAYQ